MVTGRLVTVIQARMGSSRLPGKILAPLVDHTPLLAVLVERIRTSGVDIWIATTRESQDDVTAAWGRHLKLNVYRGETHDVLSRFAAIAEETGAEWVVRLTGDNPFTDAAIVSRLMLAADSAPENIDRVHASGAERTLPLGYAPSVIRASTLIALHRELSMDRVAAREHVSITIPHDRCEFVPTTDLPARRDWRWTVDEGADLEMAQATFGLIRESWVSASYTDLVELLSASLTIPEMNANVCQLVSEKGPCA